MAAISTGSQHGLVLHPMAPSVLSRICAFGLFGLLAVAGCSSSDNGAAPTTTSPPNTTTTAPTTTTTQPAITKAVYLERANSICEEMNTKVAAIPDPGDDPLKTAVALDAASAIITETLSQLRGLPTPPGDTAIVDAIYAKVDAMLADYGVLASALRRGDSATASQLSTTVSAAQKTANDASNEYGLTICGS